MVIMLKLICNGVKVCLHQHHIPEAGSQSHKNSQSHLEERKVVKSAGGGLLSSKIKNYWTNKTTRPPVDIYGESLHKHATVHRNHFTRHVPSLDHPHYRLGNLFWLPKAPYWNLCTLIASASVSVCYNRAPCST